MILKTTAVFLTSVMTGMQVALAGDSLVQMAFLFNTGLATISTSFIAAAVGITIGSLCAGVVYDRVTHELSFAAGLVLNGLTVIATPFTSVSDGGGLPAFTSITFFRGFTNGFVITGVQAYLMNLWLHHRYCNSILHAQNAIWSLGAAIAPFIVEIFLVEPPVRHESASTSTPETTELNKGDIGSNYTDNLSAGNSSSNSFDDVFFVSYAYVTIGAMLFIPSLLFVAAYISDNMMCHNGCCVCRTESTEHGENSDVEDLLGDEQGDEDMITSDEIITNSPPEPDNIPTWSRVAEMTFMASIVLFFFIFQLIEIMPILLLPAFAVKHLKFHAHLASNLISVFSGVQLIVNFLGVPLSSVFPSFTLLVINLSLAALSSGLLLALVNTWPDVIWLTTALSGVAVSSTFPAALLWITETHPLTGRISALVFCGYSTSNAFGPAFVGWLFETVTPMCFVYLEFAASVGHLILFMCMVTFVSRFLTGKRLSEEKSVSKSNDQTSEN